MSDAAFEVIGNKPLYGEVSIQKAKNAVLPMIAAALLPKTGTTVIHNVPELADVLVALELARYVGAKVTHDLAAHRVEIDASDLHESKLPVELSKKLRGSILFLAPLLLRLGHVELPGSGGCDIGSRKIDFHHRGFARLGATVEHIEGTDDDKTLITMTTPRLRGALLYLDMPSHTGTENLMMGAALAQGITIIENASVEPEVIDFAHFLTQMGAKIHGIGTSTLTIEGVDALHAVEYTAIPDRLVAGLVMMSVGITGGDVTLRGVEPTHMRIVTAKLEQMGLSIASGKDTLRVQRNPNKPLNPINITTHPYPGYPTDLQPCISALATTAQGESFIRERIFENRYDFIGGLLSMGADAIISQSNVLVIRGVKHLRAAHVKAESIRAGAAVLIASLGAYGTTYIDNVYQIDRGHENIEGLLSSLGARIRRITRQNALEPA